MEKHARQYTRKSPCNASVSKIRLDGRKLVRLRAARDWTQNEAADKADIGRNTYKNAEKGLEIQAAKAGSIAMLFGKPIEELEVHA